MSETAQFVAEIVALLGVLVILIRELRLTRREMNGMKDELVKEVGKAAFAAGVKAQKEVATRLAEKHADDQAQQDQET